MADDRLIWWNGHIVPWHDARVHVTSETALRGLNVFEGLRAYWRQPENIYHIVGLNQHLERLAGSAKLLAISNCDLVPRIRQGIEELLRCIGPEGDLYLRPTIYVEVGAYELDPGKMAVGAFISWRPALSLSNRVLHCAVSSWLRVPPRCLPSRAKIGATYTAFRLARLEALGRGMDEAILLNMDGHVAETAGGSVFAVRDGIVCTPPLEDGILPSITRRIVMETLCPALNVPTLEVSLAVSDLHAADELFIAGTLDEISSVLSVDAATIQPCSSGLTPQIQRLYYLLCRGMALTSSGWVTAIKVGAR